MLKYAKKKQICFFWTFTAESMQKATKAALAWYKALQVSSFICICFCVCVCVCVCVSLQKVKIDSSYFVFAYIFSPFFLSASLQRTKAISLALLPLCNSLSKKNFGQFKNNRYIEKTNTCLFQSICLAPSCPPSYPRRALALSLKIHSVFLSQTNTFP